MVNCHQDYHGSCYNYTTALPVSTYIFFLGKIVNWKQSVIHLIHLNHMKLWHMYMYTYIYMYI
jgi:hypothetical protein